MLLKQVGEDISFQFSKLWGRWEPGAWALCSNTSTTGTLELYSTTPWAGSCSTGSTCCASEKEVGDQNQPPGWAVPTSSPLGSSQIQSQCPLALVTLKREALILLVGDLPLPLPTSAWRMKEGSLCTSNLCTSVEWVWNPVRSFCFPSFPSDLDNSG